MGANTKLRLEKEKMCSGQTPKSGKWAGLGGSCNTWGWSEPWCYVRDDYKGPFDQFVKPSKVYDGLFFAPCTEEKKKGRTVVGVVGKLKKVLKKALKKKVLKKLPPSEKRGVKKV